MIKAFLLGHNYEYEVKELLKLFYSSNNIEIFIKESDIYLKPETINEDTIISRLVKKYNKVDIITEFYFDHKKNEIKKELIIEEDNYITRKKVKRLIKSSLYELLKNHKKVFLPWGFLTGIRPTKIVHELLNEGKTYQEIAHILEQEYFISQEKISLLLEIVKTQHRYIYPIDDQKVSIYISIPFCPTRCSYCSFPSNPLDRYKNYRDSYVTALCKEIKGISDVLKSKGKDIETIYIGGGTPTTLEVDHFVEIFNSMENNFNLSKLKEFTIEAGRPDTIDIEKLTLFKNRGVNRISINPQTMNNCTLKEIGRNHSTLQVLEAYELAKQVGFDNINMDVIIGLPGENPSMVRNTMERIKELEPTNLTIHTLAIKNASKLKEIQYSSSKDAKVVEEMLKITEKYARDMGLTPYYLYRQKHMVGNLENIGYSKPGYECIYNIQIMEEKQTIIALGAGAATKIVYPKENRLERVANVKNLEQYIERVEEMIERKVKYFL